jgi:RNA polymerase sigma factor (sigma-70 family)
MSLKANQESKRPRTFTDNAHGLGFEDLYARYFVPVFRYIRLRVNDHALAEDLVQTVFLKVYEAQTGEPPKQLPLPYFFAVARNTVIDFWRKKKDVRLDEMQGAEEIASGDATPHDKVIQNEIKNDVHTALQKITDEQRDALVLKFINDFSNKEIAEIMGKSEDAVRQLHSRGLAALRQVIQHDV